MKNNKVTIIILAIVVVVAAFYYFSGSTSTNESTGTPVTATTTTDSATPAVNPATGSVKPATGGTTAPAYAGDSFRINQRKLINNVFVTPIHLTLDSRCPVDVKCIQAGTVDVNTLLQSGNLSQNFILSVGKTVTFAGKKITLTSVAPQKTSTKTLAESDYTFVITVK